MLIREYSGKLNGRHNIKIGLINGKYTGEERASKVLEGVRGAASDRLDRLMEELKELATAADRLHSPSEKYTGLFEKSYELKEEIISTIFYLEELR